MLGTAKSNYYREIFDLSHYVLLFKKWLLAFDRYAASISERGALSPKRPGKVNL